jgi:hypothetical protein
MIKEFNVLAVLSKYCFKGNIQELLCIGVQGHCYFYKNKLYKFVRIWFGEIPGSQQRLETVNGLLNNK